MTQRVYEALDRATKGLSAFAVTENGKHVARVIVRHATATTVWAQVWGAVNCIAVILDDETGRPTYYGKGLGFVEAVTSVFDYVNSDVWFSSAGQEYLDERCVRVAADLARKLHPKLLHYIETP